MKTNDPSLVASKTVDAPLGEKPERLAGKLPPISNQMDPGQRDYRVYTLISRRETVALVLVPRINLVWSSGTFPKDIEYWFNVSSVAPSGSLRVSWEDFSRQQELPAAMGGAESFRMNQNVAWASALGTMPTTSPSIFVNNNLKVILGWNIHYSSTSNGWSGALSWFNATGLNNIFSEQMMIDAGMSGATSALLTANTACSTGKYEAWYMAQVPPILV